eukprot:4858871-Lingulodinium_polyedra.AAC.1
MASTPSPPQSRALPQNPPSSSAPRVPGVIVAHLLEARREQNSLELDLGHPARAGPTQSRRGTLRVPTK